MESCELVLARSWSTYFLSSVCSGLSICRIQRKTKKLFILIWCGEEFNLPFANSSQRCHKNHQRHIFLDCHEHTFDTGMGTVSKKNVFFLKKHQIRALKKSKKLYRIKMQNPKGPTRLFFLHFYQNGVQRFSNKCNRES